MTCVLLALLAALATTTVHAQNAPGDDPDGDGISNLTDLDDDNDGILDSDEGYAETCALRTTADAVVASIPSEFGTGREVERTNDGQLTTFGGAPSDENPADVLGDVTYSFNSPLPVLRAIRFYSNAGTDLSSGQIRLIDTVTLLDDQGNTLAQVSNVAIAQASQAPGYTEITFGTPIAEVAAVRFTNLRALDSDLALWRDVFYDFCFPSSGNSDADGDGVGDSFDLDSDNDGIADLLEAGLAAGDIAALAAANPSGRYGGAVNANGVPLAANGGSGWGRGSGITLDADADGIPDAIEAQPTVGYASVEEGNIDAAGVTNAGAGLFAPLDTDGDGTPDFRDTDTDADGIVDADEIAAPISATFASTDGGVDPLTLQNLQNPSTPEVDYREANLPDLSVVKTGPTDPVLPGQVVSFSLTVSNAGAGVANAVLTDSPGSGLDCTQPSADATCTASGGATCPSANVPVADLLGSGITLPDMPQGGELVVMLQCTVTATGEP
ncbi:DUF11 domain-containing protein [Pseudoxanthomonas dokdonensis]|uniref:DUF11 domain-containing protein n=1 Tax=Pseudoxanthomonas dokdonensis TaxID=344882 RepID=A0A0R0CNY0_9GAMM|nr:DUF11 domain-containing protein [Pseudoxanthomonas dokdonensis]KRG71693.1 hypothetical protein ABB29_02860 [Pseudoxanthomonas dokdonensis]